MNPTDRTVYFREHKRKKRQEARDKGLKRVEVWCYPETEAAVRAYVTRQNARAEKQRAE